MALGTQLHYITAKFGWISQWLNPTIFSWSSFHLFRVFTIPPIQSMRFSNATHFWKQLKTTPYKIATSPLYQFDTNTRNSRAQFRSTWYDFLFLLPIEEYHIRSLIGRKKQKQLKNDVFLFLLSYIVINY